MNDELTWDDQVSKICRNVFFTSSISGQEEASKIGDIVCSTTILLVQHVFIEKYRQTSLTTGSYIQLMC
jgi:hypothetical protein